MCKNDGRGAGSANPKVRGTITEVFCYNLFYSFLSFQLRNPKSAFRVLSAVQAFSAFMMYWYKEVTVCAWSPRK